MNKGELIDAVAAATDDTKAGAGRAVDAVIESITGALKKGDTVTLIGFGTFKTEKCPLMGIFFTFHNYGTCLKPYQNL